MNASVWNVPLICFPRESWPMDPTAFLRLRHCICPKPRFSMAVSSQCKNTVGTPKRPILAHSGTPNWGLWLKDSLLARLNFLRILRTLYEVLLSSYTVLLSPSLSFTDVRPASLPISSLHLLLPLFFPSLVFFPINILII